MNGFFSGVADKVNFANRRLTDKKNLTSAVDNNLEESRLKQYSLYQSREPAYTKYQFFRPHSKGKNFNNWIGKPHLSNVPIAAMLKLLMTGKFDVIANFARLEIVPTRKNGNLHQQPYVTLPEKSQYNFYPRPSAFSFLSQGYKPFKEMTYRPQEGITNYLPQFAVGQPVIQDTVAQPVPQSAGPKGYSVSRQPDQVSFENMYQQYQKMQEKLQNNEKSYSDLSKLYEIMNALKALHTESNEKGQQISSETKTNRPATQAIKNPFSSVSSR